MIWASSNGRRRCFSLLPLLRRLIFLPLLPFFGHVSANGSTTAQCPDGHYLARFNSAFDGTERFYKFGCAKFHGGWTAAMLEERCEVTELARMENGGDAYLSCGSDQYTAGVRVLDGTLANGESVEWWQLLCCRSPSVQVRTADCIETKFINDFRRSSSFSSSAQVIRRWQAMYENGDRRWWLQICPVDVNLVLKKQRPGAGIEVRARRQVPWEWRSRRFPPEASAHIYATGPNVNSFAVHTEQRLVSSERRGTDTAVVGHSTTTTSTTARTMTSSTSHISVAEKEEMDDEEAAAAAAETVDMPKLSTRSPLMRQHGVAGGTRLYNSNRSNRLNQFNERIRTRFVGTVSTPQQQQPVRTTTARAPNGRATGVASESPTGAIDYYDMYDENFDREKHEGGGLLGGVSDFIQSIQDGLTLAQVAFPNEAIKLSGGAQSGGKGFHMKIAVTPPPKFADREQFLFSRDEQVEDQQQDAMQHIGSFVQQGDKKLGPRTKPPTASRAEQKQRESNTIESMLQMIGLCQGHSTDL